MTPEMAQLMQEWLAKRGIDFSPDEAENLCSVTLGLEGDNLDACVSYVYAFEKGELNEDDFVAALCELTGKPPEELVGAIKNREVLGPTPPIKPAPVDNVKILAEFYGVSEEEVLDAYAPKRHLTPGERGYTEPITWGQMYKIMEDAQEVIKNREVPDATKGEAVSDVGPRAEEGDAELGGLRQEERDKPGNVEPT